MAWNARSQAAIPRILPLVRHRDDVLVYHVEPFAVPHLPGARLHRVGAVFLEPFVHVETKVLLAPEHPGQCLTHDPGLVFANPVRSDGSIELVRLTPARLHDFSKLVPERFAHGGGRLVAQPQPDGGRFPGAHRELVVRGGFRPVMFRVDGVLLSGHHIVVDPVFDITAGIGRAEDPLVVGLVLREQQRDFSLAVQETVAQFGVDGGIRTRVPFAARDLLQEPASAYPATRSRCCETRESAGHEAWRLPARDCTR